MGQAREVLENEYKAIEKQINVLENKKEKIKEEYLESAKFKVGEIVKVKGWSDVIFSGWIKEVLVSSYELRIEYKIGTLKADGTLNKRTILSYGKAEKDIMGR